uniref:Uncharacterized protein n=1 Tax=Salix viminalis TaxID=40686 RepID=A0A6N2L3V5_SALVM
MVYIMLLPLGSGSGWTARGMLTSHRRRMERDIVGLGKGTKKEWKMAAQWIERLFPKQKVVGSTPTWRDSTFWPPSSSSMGSAPSRPKFSLVCKLANGDGGWELGSSVWYKLGLVFKESLKRCEISDSTTCILAARFNASPDEMKPVEKLISGKEIKLEGLEGRANQSQMQKVTGVIAKSLQFAQQISSSILVRVWDSRHSGLEVGISSLADAITCRIAACDAL